MNLSHHLKFYRVVVVSTLLVAGLLSSVASASADSWSRTALGKISEKRDPDGILFLDINGKPQLFQPEHHQPSAVVTSQGLNVLRFSASTFVPPYEVDADGSPLLGDHFSFDSLLFSENAWERNESFSGWVEDAIRPRYVSCMNDALLVSYWDGLYLYIDTLDESSPTRLTLPIPAMKGSVAMDANGGLHILSIDDDYELWHRYYSEEALTAVKLSDGPVCDVVVEAGLGDVCHVAYTTFSEDLNLNEVLDDGEDVNGNSVLDVLPHTLTYQLIDANVQGPAEIVVADSLIRICYLDLLYSSAYGLSLAYANPVSNAIRLAQRGITSWSIEQVSSSIGSYGPVALAMKSNGDRVVSFVTQDGLKLSVTEEAAGAWSESLIRASDVGDYFAGTDVEVLDNGEVVVLAIEKSTHSYLSAYSSSALPLLEWTQPQPVSIRSAFIVTWPTPGEGVVQQILQCTADVSDPDSWEAVDQKDWYSWEERVELETVVEQESQNFYRVLEVSE